MPLTRAQDEEILQFFLQHVLRIDDKHDIRKCYKEIGISNFWELLATDTAEFFNQFYDDPQQGEEGQVVKRYLPCAQANRCKHLRNFTACIVDEYEYIPPLIDWRNRVTYETYMVYCANPRMPQQVSTTHIPTAATTQSMAAAFQRGNKRNIA